MKQSLQPIIKKFAGTIAFLTRHMSTMLFTLFAGLAGFLVIRIGMLAQAEPTPDEITEATLSAKTLKIDESAITQLTSLQDRNISLEALFDNGRTNPFEN